MDFSMVDRQQSGSVGARVYTWVIVILAHIRFFAAVVGYFKLLMPLAMTR